MGSPASPLLVNLVISGNQATGNGGDALTRALRRCYQCRSLKRAPARVITSTGNASRRCLPDKQRHHRFRAAL
jgi:hypothetical protein